MPVITEADGKGGLQAAQDHKKGEGKTIQHLPGSKRPGPVIPTDMPEKANNDDLEQRFKEVNKEEPQQKEQ